MRLRHLRCSLGLLLGALLAFPATAPTSASDQVSGQTESSDEFVDTLSLDDQVGQLFLLGFAGSTADGAEPALQELRAGGLMLLDNVESADAARALTQNLQTRAQANGLLPLLIATNHEGGRVQPIQDGTTLLGSNFNVGQVEPRSLALATACSRGAIHAADLHGMGIHMNLAPVLDVHDNPLDTVIGDRSFGSDPQRVAELGAAYVEGLQSGGVLAVGKHFPGHGSANVDSHLGLPVVNHDRSWLDTHELVPFRAAIQAGVAGIMVGHLSFPLVDPVPGRPASLSRVFVDGLLRGDLRYTGLVLTDDLGAMRAITDTNSPGESAIQAIAAGADVLTVVGALDRQRRMVEAVHDAIGTRISAERLKQSVSRVITAKRQANLLGLRAPSAFPSELCPASVSPPA
jgi:beta-N-acetylhexosaminidase